MRIPTHEKQKHYDHFFFWGGGGGGGLEDGNRYGLKEPRSPTLRCAPATLKSPFSVAPETRDSVTDQ